MDDLNWDMDISNESSNSQIIKATPKHIWVITAFVILIFREMKMAIVSSIHPGKANL